MTSDIVVDVVELSEEEMMVLKEQLEKERREREEMLESLAMSITDKFTTRAARRQVKESEWLESQRLYLGKLSVFPEISRTDDPFRTRNQNHRPDVNIVRAKVNIAIAQTVSQQFGTTNKNWSLYPEEGNDDPLVAEACRRMEDEIANQLDKCRYSKKARQAMEDRVILGTGILKGPVNTGKMKKTYRPIEGTEMWEPYVEMDRYPSAEHVNPWFFYPDDTTNDPENLQNSIEIHPMSALELKKYMKHPGFMAEAIEDTLKEKPDEFVNANYSEYATLTESNPYLFKDKYLVLEYHGPITKSQLDRLGIEPTYDSPNEEYYGEVWVVHNRVIRVELENIEACFKIPYYMSVWNRDPAHVFGFGVPIMMRDAQRVVNQTWHMILDNSSISSGPQVAMQKNFIEPADGEWTIEPRKVWYLTDPQVTVDQAIQFFYPPNVTPNLQPVLEMARLFSEEESTIPLITAGLQSPQPADSATGALVYRQASTTLLDFLGEDWSDTVTGPLIEAWYGWNMQYNPRQDIKGAYAVDVRTGIEYKNKELYLRDLERLSLEVTQNPVAAMLVRPEEIMRARIEMMNLPSDHMIKTPEEIEAEKQAAAQQPSPDQIEMQMEQTKLELESRRLELEEAKMAFEMGQAQQRELWDHEEKMTANYARTVEAEARVATAQTEKEMEMLKLMQRDKEFAAKMMQDEQLALMNARTEAFLKSMEETRKQREAMIKEKEIQQYSREIDLAQKRGKGI